MSTTSTMLNDLWNAIQTEADKINWLVNWVKQAYWSKKVEPTPTPEPIKKYRSNPVATPEATDINNILANEEADNAAYEQWKTQQANKINNNRIASVNWSDTTKNDVFLKAIEKYNQDKNFFTQDQLNTLMKLWVELGYYDNNVLDKINNQQQTTTTTVQPTTTTNSRSNWATEVNTNPIRQWGRNAFQFTL